MKILSTKKYNDLTDKLDYYISKNVDLLLDSADKDAEMKIYNDQVNYLMGQVEDLTSKLDKAKKKIAKLEGKDKPVEKKKAGRPKKVA